MNPVHLAVARFLARHGISRAEGVLLAISGGGDSIALMHACASLGQTVQVAHVHHGLRGEAADRDASSVLRSARVLGLPVHLERLDGARRRSNLGGRLSPEASARAGRYAALEHLRCRLGLEYIATAHTLEDQAETLLLRAIRGADLAGLAAIAAFDSARRLIRPVLEVERVALRSYLEARGLGWCEDASNLDLGVPRNRIRHAVLPELARAHPEAVPHLARLATSAQEWRDARRSERQGRLRSVCLEVRTGYWIRLDRLRCASRPERRELLAQLLCELGLQERLAHAQIALLERACRPGAKSRRITLPDAVEFVLDGDCAWLGRRSGVREGFERQLLRPGVRVPVGPHGFEVWLARPDNAASAGFQLPLPLLDLSDVAIRPLSRGDSWPSSRPGAPRRTVVERLRRAGWPARLRSRALLIENGLRPVGVLAMDAVQDCGESGAWRSLTVPAAQASGRAGAGWEVRAERVSGIPPSW